jgi:sugar transferase (PEP-CTERM/EpsH1 system associated)
MNILYVAHCVPWPPDKGERIRAYHSLRFLLDHYRVHLACIARSPAEAAIPSPLRDRCASVRIETLAVPAAMVRGARQLAAGGSFTAGFYEIPALQAHIAAIRRSAPIRAVVLLSSGMARYAPVDIPYIADWGDVDSEKRLEYGRVRRFGLLHRVEGLRLRQVERDYALPARRTFLTTPNELRIFRSIAPEAALACCGNGVDSDFFDPAAGFAARPELAGRNILAFVGQLGYFPNADGILRFANTEFPDLRRRDPTLELFVIGRNPPPAVLKLAEQPGVTVTGAVADVRPYLAAARGVVVPLRIARGIQNKVLEALAMGKRVLGSAQICATFAPDLPAGLLRCATVEDYAAAIATLPADPAPDLALVAETRTRFAWSAQLAPLLETLDAIEHEGAAVPVPA